MPEKEDSRCRRRTEKVRSEAVKRSEGATGPFSPSRAKSGSSFIPVSESDLSESCYADESTKKELLTRRRESGADSRSEG